MSDKKSLQEALQNSLIEKNRKEEKTLTASEKLLAEKNLVRLTFEIDSNVHLQLDQMKRDLRRKFVKNLIIEAFNDLFIKYGYSPIA